MNAELARCAAHPENTAVGSCSRCGTFVCSADQSVVFGKLYCATCAARPEVNYLEALRLKYWGKRDSWGWWFGLSAIGYISTAALYTFIQREYVSGLISVAGATVCVFYWLGRPWARFAVLGIPLANVAYGLSTRRFELVGIGVFGLMVAATPLSDTRNQLFFQLPVTEHALKKYWDLYLNNRAARNGAMLAIGSLLMPLFIPLAIAFSIVGLLRVDPNATPPIGKRWYAIFGLVVSLLMLGVWGSFFAGQWR